MARDKEQGEDCLNLLGSILPKTLEELRDTKGQQKGRNVGGLHLLVSKVNGSLGESSRHLAVVHPDIPDTQLPIVNWERFIDGRTDEANIRRALAKLLLVDYVRDDYGPRRAPIEIAQLFNASLESLPSSLRVVIVNQ